MRSWRALLSLTLAGALLAACGESPTAAPPPAPTPRPEPTAIAPVGNADPSPTARPAPRARPNVLVIETDDMRSDELKWMPSVRTYIAGQGLSFANSFAPYPLCCPSRASFLDGQYAHNHGVLSHVDPFGFQVFDDRRTIATQLQGAGYRTALLGKYLNGYGEQPVRGTTRSSLRYVPPGWTDWQAGSDHRWPKGATFSGSTYNYFNVVLNVDGQIKEFPGQYNTTVVAERTRSRITAYGKGTAPWFVWWNPIAPHHGKPIEADDPRDMRRSNGGPQRWDTPARPGWVKGIFDNRIPHGLGTPLDRPAEPDVSDKPRYIKRQPALTAPERGAEREVTRQRAEALYALDREIGQTLNTLRSTGQADRTIVVFTSDNGYFLGEHRKRQGKINLYEPSLRVPLLMVGPGIPRGKRYDPVSTVDIASTLARWAGLGSMPGSDGQAMQPLIRRGDRGWSRAVVMESLIPEYRHIRNAKLGFDSALNSRGLRLGRWKYTRYSSGEEELYDLRADPMELRNLQADPGTRGTVRAMRRLWQRYSYCKQARCRVPLPASLRVTAAENQRITDTQVRRTNVYYGN